MSNRNQSQFAFVGFTVQEPYFDGHPEWEGYNLATLDFSIRASHPQFDARDRSIVGAIGRTPFHLRPPRNVPNGWIVSAYSIELGAYAERFGTCYDATPNALELINIQPELESLGFDVIDGVIEYISILVNCGLGARFCREYQLPLTRFGLLESPDSAMRFIRLVRELYPDEPHFQRPVIWQVFAQP